MKLGNVTSLSDFKANASGMLKEAKVTKEPIVITQNGRAEAIVQDIESYEKIQQTLALMKVLALGQKQIARGEVVPAKEVFRELRGRNRKS